MTPSVTCISSMATRAVLAELAEAYEVQAGVPVVVESLGGVNAAKRLRAGEIFDVAVLASDAIDELVADGCLDGGSKVDLMRSGVAVAVRAGAPRPDVTTEDAVRRAVLDAQSIGTSTGPSGVRLGQLFERWGIAEKVRSRVVTPPPGVPVGALLSGGAVELGFQQLSELIHVEGIDVLGPLPESIQIVTTFSGALGTMSRQDHRARALLAFMASPAAEEAKRRQGMGSPDGGNAAGRGMSTGGARARRGAQP